MNRQYFSIADAIRPDLDLSKVHIRAGARWTIAADSGERVNDVYKGTGLDELRKTLHLFSPDEIIDIFID